MAHFLRTVFLGLQTLDSIISDISPSILEVFVSILLQIENHKYANLSQQWNLTFFQVEIFHIFTCSYALKYQNEKRP